MMHESAKGEMVMKFFSITRRVLCLFSTLTLMISLFSGCSAGGIRTTEQALDSASLPDTARFLVAVEDEPDTVDFQCTTIHYTVAQNVFNRLVELESNKEGDLEILPSLAQSWEVSEDGRVYTFHLRDNVFFSNGEPLTASAVLYTQSGYCGGYTRRKGIDERADRQARRH